MRRPQLLTHILCTTIVAFVISAPPPAYAAATITVFTNDGATEGFNDPTPATPVGGNPGTTLGQQRQIAFLYAANIWAKTLDSNVEIFVLASFDPLGANVLGSAGASVIVSNFPGVGSFPGSAFPNTWYHSALADKRAGVEQAPGFFDIRARFNTQFTFYLGLDNNHGPLSDLVVVVLHELAHGLGFSTFVTASTGANFAGQTDIYSQFTLDVADNTVWSDYGMDSQRAASALRVDRLVWIGSASLAAVPHVLSFGRPELAFNNPPALGPSVRVGTAAFGPALTSAGVTGHVVLGVDSSTDPVPPAPSGSSRMPASHW